jgi:hypothetical protein
MPQLFQITEDNLGELEQILPQLADALLSNLDNRLRVKLRRCQAILSNVRWNYGPPRNVKAIPAEPDEDTQIL